MYTLLQLNQPMVFHIQSTLRPPEVHMFYQKIGICIVYMGVSHMHTTCRLPKNNCLTYGIYCNFYFKKEH